MYDYNMYEWVAFFIIYCFIGWVGESLYVSWECKKWVNRGFMNGPFLPIYGFGAIIMLFAALPVRNNIFLIFLFGMLAATALEYVTGWAIEKIFKVRYWDYSYEPFNIQGYICLGCSLTWGLCAMLLLRVLHSPVEDIVKGIHPTVLKIFDYVFVAYFIFDMYVSVRQALDLRKVITEYIKHNAEIQRLQKRIDVIIAVINDDKENFENKLEESRENFRNKLEESVENRKNRIEESKENTRAELEKLKAAIEERRTSYRNATEGARSRAFKVVKRNPGVSNKKHHITAETIKKVLIKYKHTK